MHDAVRDAFPELADLADADLADRVAQVWADGLAASDFETLEAVPFSPKYAEDIGDVRLVDHTRDVTRWATTLADTAVSLQDVDLDRDIVLAGAVLHDVSKLHEYSAYADGMFGDQVPHPYYGVHMVAAADLPTHLQHIVVSHSGSTPVKPTTIEAKLVEYGDLLAVHGLFWNTAEKLFPND
ncbi:HD domain-containing protein [Salinirubellus salinus]|uniref:HD domain-containing protein n=1 Tax=Salinirubellus salinus TaxID=1364945 RepID=A0A9E7R449_9EURY|nr:HD domain-containing protein [Salinirubellus salinus]UWM54428.1 HD domain-containing protein [Salinirubellus salinus]